MLPVTLLVWIGVIVVVLALLFLFLWKQYRKVGPNEVLVISGGKRHTVTDPDGTKRTIGYRTCIGGGTFVIPFLETTQTLSLEVFTITMKTPEVPTAHGVPVIAEGVAQVKVKGDDYSIRQAVEQFLGKGAEVMRDVAHQILEGHFRAALGTMSIEEICSNREKFARRVEEASSKDCAGMGLQVLSFALKDITDTQGYIEALGKPQVAAVKRDAIVAEAEASRDATINSAVAKKEGDIAKLKADIEIAQANRDYEARRAEFQTVVNQKKAQADFAYDLERHKMNQQIKKEEYKTKLVEKEHAISVEEKEILRIEKELESTVKKPAQAEAFRLQEEAKAKVEAKKLEGISEVEYLREKGKAEADAMRYKAESWKEYNEAAIYQMFAENLPQLARAIAEPLSKVDKIIMVGGGGDGSIGASRITGEVAQMLAQLPTIIESLSGVDIKKFLERLPEIKSRAGISVPAEKKPKKKRVIK